MPRSAGVHESLTPSSTCNAGSRFFTRGVHISAPVAVNLRAISAALGKPVEDLTVVMLDRPRHAQLLSDIRAAGARCRLLSDGDVAAAIAAARPDSGVDVLMGVGGCAEGVIAAAALKCMGGAIQGRLWPRHEEDRKAILAAGLDPEEVRFPAAPCRSRRRQRCLLMCPPHRC